MISCRLEKDVNTVGLWHFIEQTGSTVYDKSGNSNNGTLYNSPTWGNIALGGGLSFNAANSQYVEVPNHATLKPTDITVEAILKKTANVTGKIIVSKYAATPCEYELSISVDGYLIFRVDKSTGGQWVYDTNLYSNYPLNSIMYVVGTYNSTSSESKIYVNGNLKKITTNVTRDISRTDPLRFAARAYPGVEGYWTGGLICVRISNIARSAAEIKHNWLRMPQILTT